MERERTTFIPAGEQIFKNMCFGLLEATTISCSFDYILESLTFSCSILLPGESCIKRKIKEKFKKYTAKNAKWGIIYLWKQYTTVKKEELQWVRVQAVSA